MDAGSDDLTDHRGRWRGSVFRLADGNADGNFNFNFGDVFDLERGHVVTVSDGTTKKRIR